MRRYDFSAPTYNTETRDYNARLQLTDLEVTNPFYPNAQILVKEQYEYSVKAPGSQDDNNGQIRKKTDYVPVPSETVTYQYDELKRLTQADTSFTYDGFGNLTAIGGTSQGVVSATNRRSAPTFYDANGNVTSTPGPANCTLTLNYDGMNRLASTTGCGTESYGYGPDGKRVYRSTGGQELVYLYGALGERIGTYVAYVGSSITFNAKEVNLYFGGRVVFTSGANPQYDPWQNVFVDRLGSVVKRGTSTDGSVARWTTLQYRAYGQEKAVTEQDRDKFATYLRDGVTGLDYAQQRYYSSTMGRFLSVDSGPVEATNPQSYNRYSYAWSDPINMTDSNGLLPGPVQFDDSVGAFLRCVDQPIGGPFGWKGSVDMPAPSLPTTIGYDWRNYHGPFPDFRVGDRKKVEEAYLRAEGRTNNKDCDEALASQGIPSLGDLLRRYKPGETLFDGRRSTYVIRGGTETVQKRLNRGGVGAIVVKARDSNGSLEPVGTFLGSYFFGAAGDLGRDLILLHESVHQFANRGDVEFGGSQDLSKIIADNCFTDTERDDLKRRGLLP